MRGRRGCGDRSRMRRAKHLFRLKNNAPYTLGLFADRKEVPLPHYHS